MKSFVRIFSAPGLILVLSLASAPLATQAESLKLELRRIMPAGDGKSQWTQVTNRVTWEGSATAVVICDMWDKHWCKGATARV